VRTKKFSRGEKLSVQEALEHIAAGRWVYWQNKPQHPSWLGSMQFLTLVGAAKMGLLREAVPNEEAKE
jgi:hypothetical protein